MRHELGDLPLARIRDVALSRAAERGASFAAMRAEATHHQYLSLRDGLTETVVDDLEVGFGVRVVKDGSLGFAASVEVTEETAIALADQAIDLADATATARAQRVELAPEPSHGEVSWTSSYEKDPTTVGLAERTERLGEWSRRLLASPGVRHIQASLHDVVEDTYYGDSSGTVTSQRRVRLHPVLEALAVADDGDFETMRTLAPPVGRGYEYLLGEGWDFDEELEELPGLLAEKLVAPSVEPGDYDLLIDPTNLWLTIHESVGHATELDRALGYEAAYAGTSFAKPEFLGTLRYGSELMNITGDRTTPHGLATVGYDDEGVVAQSFDIVRDGVLVGYQLDRQIAAECGFPASNGCAFAESGLLAPIQRMANVSLRPERNGPTLQELLSDIERGIYVVGDKSWSIDMQRHNFQFTGQRFFKVEHGRLVGQLRDVAYQSETTAFWGSLARLGGESTYLLAGATNCGKGQPGQAAPVSHGCPAALFTNVRILNVRAESGR